MSYSITNAKADLEGMLHGTTLNQITNLNGVFNRAGRQLIEDIDPQETKRLTEFTNPIFYQVYDYAIPTDLKGNKVIDIRPQTTRYPQDVYNQDYNQAFDLAKGWWSSGNQFTINFDSGVKTIRINSPFLPQGTVVNQISGVNDNGTFNVGGGASNIATNNINFINFGGSIQFNLDAGQATGYVENSTMSSQDLSDQVNQGTEFIFVYLPDASAITSVSLRWGSSSADYYTRTKTVNQQGNAFENGWNLLSFDWVNATTVGSPDASEIDYVRITFSYDSTLQTGVLINSYASRMGTILILEYYSKYLFRDGLTGVFQETVTDDSNLLNLDTESYNLFLYQTALLAAQQQQGKGLLSFDSKFFSDMYEKDVARYMAMYKSEVQKPRSIYYQKPYPGYSQFISRRNY